MAKDRDNSHHTSMRVVSSRHPGVYHSPGMKPNVSKWLSSALLLVFSSACFAQLASYPRSKGPVSDYADKLSQAQVADLTSLIEEYKRQSSIEIAVVW